MAIQYEQWLYLHNNGPPTEFNNALIGLNGSETSQQINNRIQPLARTPDSLFETNPH